MAQEPFQIAKVQLSNPLGVLGMLMFRYEYRWVDCMMIVLLPLMAHIILIDLIVGHALLSFPCSCSDQDYDCVSCGGGVFHGLCCDPDPDPSPSHHGVNDAPGSGFCG